VRFPSYSALPNGETSLGRKTSLMALRSQGEAKKSMSRAIGLCSANVIIFHTFYFLGSAISHPVITFSPNGRHLVVDYSSNLFPSFKRRCHDNQF